MTEAEWMRCNDPTSMLRVLEGKVSQRKLRLATCAFCSHIRGVTKDEFYHAAVDASEDYADGQILLSTKKARRLLRVDGL